MVAERWFRPIQVSTTTRLFTIASVSFLLSWQLGLVIGWPGQTGIVLGLYGFVFHMIFAKGYALIPAYFAREFRLWWVPVIHLPATVLGTMVMAADGAFGPVAVGAGLWFGGVVAFVGALGWTAQDNLTGRETGTSQANIDRKWVDRAANAFMPLALVYLVVGSYGTLAVTAGLPWVFDAYPPRITHLLAAGAGAMLVFAIGFRLLPRFMVARPARSLVAIVLVAGSIGPIVIAGSIPAGPWLPVGAVVQTIAIVGFAIAVVGLLAQSDRRRVGFYGVLLSVGFGVLASGFGLALASGLGGPVLVDMHMRANLLGFLGLMIIGVSYQFYPPRIGSFPLAGNTFAYGVISVIAAGLLIEVTAVLLTSEPGVLAGRLLTLGGIIGHAYLIIGLFVTR